MRSTSSADGFIQSLQRLLELERQAEVDEGVRLQATLSTSELEKRGWTLLRLRIVDELAGLGGRTLVALEPSRDGDLPAHRFQPGDIAALKGARGSGVSGGKGEAPTGVVYRVNARRITIALDDDPEEPLEEPIRIDRVANDITYRRMREALERLRTQGRGPSARLREVLLGLRNPQLEKASSVRRLERLDPSLDASQCEAVAFALAARDVALLHGPPGTGKTTAAVELIRHAVSRGEKVLACAPSNIAVDNLVERLGAAGTRVVRLGHPARLLPSVLRHSLDALVEEAEGTRIATRVRRELEAVHRKLRRASGWIERRALRDDLRRLRAEVREVEERTVREILSAAECILTTNTGAGESMLAELEADLVVIDEAAQALEPACWIPLLKGKRAVLVGDHRQLPPTIRSREALEGGLGTTLFDRLASEHGEELTRMLTVQYRMHESIMRFPSLEMYGGRLEAHPSVAKHLLEELPGVSSTPETAVPLFFVDTAGCGFDESVEEEGESKLNEGEAGVVVQHVGALVESGLNPAQIAVVTPYNAQVARLRSRLSARFPGLEIGSVDGFQGREKEAIVISLVRSNERGEVGFLADDRRMNVAITRARRHLALVGDSATISRHGFLARLIEHFQASGEYRSGWEYKD